MGRKKTALSPRSTAGGLTAGQRRLVQRHRETLRARAAVAALAALAANPDLHYRDDGEMCRRAVRLADLLLCELGWP